MNKPSILPKKGARVPALVLSAALLTLLSGCSTDLSPSASSNGQISSSEGETPSSSIVPSSSDDNTAFESSSFSFDDGFDSQSSEALEGTALDVSALGASYTIEDAGTYILTGENDDLSIEVSSSGDIVLILNGVTIKSAGEAGPIFVSKASSFTLHIASATKNCLEDSSANLLDGVINVKKTDFKVTGDGYLYVTSNGLSGSGSGKGLHAAKNLAISSAHIQVTGAEDHALNGKEGATLSGATILLDASGDGLHSKEGAVTVSDSSFVYSGLSDGIDAAGAISISDSYIHAETEGTYALYDSSADTDGTLYEDSKYILKNGEYVKISEDEMSNYSTRYYLENSCKGIKSDADIDISGGHLELLTADDAVNSDLSITAHSGVFDIYTGDQGLNAGTSLTVGDEGDYSDSLEINIHECYEGLQGATVLIQNGYIYINAADDGINATSDDDTASVSLSFSGSPKVRVFAEGDAADSNGDMNLLGGELALFATTKEEDAAVDFDGSFSLSGASLIACSIGGGMHSTYTSSSQYLLDATYSGSFSSGSAISLSGEGVLLSALLPVSYTSLNVLYSSPSLTKGDAYQVIQGGTLSAGYADKAYFGDDSSLLSGGSTLSSFSFSSYVTTIGSSGPGGQGGQGGRGGK